jgi:hypothetical protein
MRLVNVHTPRRLRDRIVARLISLLSGGKPPDVVITLLHRKAWFGGPFAEALQAVMRGPSAWSVGERELMAAYISKLNECRY